MFIGARDGGWYGGRSLSVTGGGACIAARVACWKFTHVKELKDGGAAFALSNLKTLCRACHFDVHRKHGTDQALTEWRDLVDTSDNNKRRGINA